MESNEQEIMQKITTNDIREEVFLSIKDVDHSPSVKSILALATEKMVQEVGREAMKLARIQGRNFVTKRDFLLASRILGIVK